MVHSMPRVVPLNHIPPRPPPRHTHTRARRAQDNGHTEYCTYPPRLPFADFTMVGFFSVTATSTSKDVLDALTTIRKKNKPYTLGFSTVGAGESGKGDNEVKGSSSSSSGGVGADGGGTDATRGEAGQQQTEESSSTDKEEEAGEGLLVEQKSALPGVGAGEDAAGGAAAGGGGGGGGEERESEGLPQKELPAESGDGEVTLKYEMYDEKFAIKVNRHVKKKPDNPPRYIPVYILCCSIRFVNDRTAVTLLLAIAHKASSEFKPHQRS